MLQTKIQARDDDDKDGDVDDGGGVHPNSHKHFIPYMGFCASIWNSVRHHCHHHHISSSSSSEMDSEAATRAAKELMG